MNNSVVLLLGLVAGFFMCTTHAQHVHFSTGWTPGFNIGKRTETVSYRSAQQEVTKAMIDILPKQSPSYVLTYHDVRLFADRGSCERFVIPVQPVLPGTNEPRGNTMCNTEHTYTKPQTITDKRAPPHHNES